MASPHPRFGSAGRDSSSGTREPVDSTNKQPTGQMQRGTPFVLGSSASHASEASPAYPPGPLLPSPFSREPPEPSPTADASHDLHLYSNFIRPTSVIAASTSSLHKEVRQDLAQNPTFDASAEYPEQDPYASQLQHSEQSNSAGELLLPPANFSPFFTLVKDASTGEYIHPSVYYVFADDDPEVVTTAALHALETDETLRQGHDERQGEASEVEDRYILLNLDSGGTNITSAQSLSSRWAVTAARLEEAPVFGGQQISTDKQEAKKNSKMLVVEGVGSLGVSDTKSRLQAEDVFEHAKREVHNTAGEADIISAMGRLYADMEGRMAVLDKAMAESGTGP